MNLKTKVILAIETSCDDTSMAIIKNDQVIANCTISSINEQAKYGGIVPEVASRNHIKVIDKVFKKTLKQAKIDISEITDIAYTSEPGLPGSLHVGKVFAKMLAKLLNVNLIKVNHLYGHIYSASANCHYEYLFLALIVSGGHTSIYLVKSIREIELINETNDDAVGEALDKIGRMLSLDYPGGISIDNLYNSQKNNLNLLPHQSSNSQFSFSGIKTATLNMINSLKMKNEIVDKELIASSCLKWIIDDIINKLNYYIDKYQPAMLVLGGGVSANKLLREEVNKLKIKIVLPPIEYTGDNAVMIGLFANELIKYSK